MLTAKDGEIIASKLSAFIKKRSRKHKVAIVRISGKEVGRFNIRRGSGELNHNYIARQIYISMKEAEEIAACGKNLPDYEASLRNSGHYPP